MPRLLRSLAVPALVLLAACGPETVVPTQQDRLAKLNVDQVIYGLEHVMTTGGVRKANLHGDTAYFKDADSRVDLKGVKLDFFNETTGATSGSLTSRTGKYDMRTGAMTATVNGRPFVTRPPVGRRSLDNGFIELRKALRRGGYRLRSCGACGHFRYSAASRDMSAGLSGYCGLGHHEAGPASLGATGFGTRAAPIVTLFYSCPDWEGRDERALADFFARQGDES